jgi:vesicle-fusing ATPase
MDGFNSSKMVLVIGSTNKLDLLDSALLRPGRFDLKIKVALPSEKDRYEIFDHYLQNKKHKLSEKYRKDLTAKLRNWSGADL